MKIALATIGSQGDIQPHIALGIALEQAGHSCFIATLPWAKSLIESYGLKHAAIGSNNADMNSSVEKIIRNSSTNSKGLFTAINYLFDTLRTCHAYFLKLFKEVDSIIGHGVGLFETEFS